MITSKDTVIRIEDLEERLRARVIIELFNNMFLFRRNVYYDKYDQNAEKFDEEYDRWLELKKIDFAL